MWDIPFHLAHSNKRTFLCTQHHQKLEKRTHSTDVEHVKMIDFVLVVPVGLGDMTYLDSELMLVL